MDMIQRQIALSQIKQLKRAHAEWEAESREYAARGFRAETCFHGTDMWVDYDPMCYHCERGTTLYELAIWQAYEYANRMQEIITFYSEACRLRMEAAKTEAAQRLAGLWCEAAPEACTRQGCKHDGNYVYVVADN